MNLCSTILLYLQRLSSFFVLSREPRPDPTAEWDDVTFAVTNGRSVRVTDPLTFVPLSLWIRLETPGMGTDLREVVVLKVGTNGLETGNEVHAPRNNPRVSISALPLQILIR